ncbi:MAG: HD domain-containing phosphohydrolase [Bdellovibrionia bacterium]
MTANKSVRLIVDTDVNFLASLSSHPRAIISPIITTIDWKKAQLCLADTNKSFTAIFVNSNLQNGNGYSVIRFAHRFRPATPIFLLLDKGAPAISTEELRQLGVNGTFFKTSEPEALFNLPRAAGVDFNVETAVQIASQNKDTVDTEVLTADTVFVPIRADSFLSGSTSIFDIYVKLSTDRYVKILKNGDAFDEKRIKNYMDKGVVFFYLRKEAQELYMTYCARLTKAINKKTQIALPTKMTYTLNHGQEVVKYLSSAGVGESAIHYATQFVGEVKGLIDAISPKENAYLGDYLSNLAIYDHAVGTAMIASLLARNLGMSSENPAKIVGLASLLHDVGILQLPKELHDEDEKKMSPEQKILYSTHSTMSAEILKSIKDVEPIVIQAVYQHHERKDKSGFPSKLGVGSINIIAEIIGLSDELVRLIQKQSSDKTLNPLVEISKVLPNRFSSPVIQAFKKEFLTAQSTDEKVKTLVTSD